MIMSAKVLAITGYEFLTDAELRAKAHEDWLEKLEGETYPTALPADAKPERW